MSYGNIYVQSAPWSVGSQGRTNVSHGCLNVSPSNAAWFYDNTKRGDILEIVNTLGPKFQAPTDSVTGTSHGSNGGPAMPPLVVRLIFG